MGNRWGNNGHSDRVFGGGGSKINADGDCSDEIKRRLLLGRKVITSLDNIFKIRDITLSIKVCLVKAMVFPVVMYGCESWTVKKTQQWPQDWKRSVSIPIAEKGNAKECSNYQTIAFISHASTVMLKILQARLQ